MSRFLSLDDAMKVVENERVVSVDSIEDIIPESQDRVRIEPGGYLATSKAAARILRGTRVSLALLREVSESTRQALLREVLFQSHRRFLVDGEMVVKVYEPEDPFIPHEQTLRLLSQSVADAAFTFVGRDVGGLWEARAVSPDWMGAEDDQIYAGVAITENGGLAVCRYVYRLVCTNGLRQLERKIYRAKATNEDELRLKLLQRIEDATKQASHFAHEFYGTRGITVENPRRRLLQVAPTLGIPARVAQEASERLPEGRSTLYDVINAVTRVARELELEKDRFQIDVELAAGRLVHSRTCDVCGSLIG